MKVEDVLSFLQKVGLSEYEAKVYKTLAMGGQMKAGKVSKLSSVPQSKVYWVLDGLIDKQLVEISDGKPKEYRAVEPSTALGRLVEEKERSVGDLRKELRLAGKVLKQEKGSQATGGIWTARGRNWTEFFDKASDMVGRSRKYVYGVTRDFSRSARLSSTVEKAAKRGVKVRVVGMQEVDETNHYKARWYLEKGVELRIIDTTLHPRIVVSDGKEVLLRLDHDHKRKEGFPFSSVWSEDPGLVKVFDTYVKNVWEGARPVDMKRLNRFK